MQPTSTLASLLLLSGCADLRTDSDVIIPAGLAVEGAAVHTDYRGAGLGLELTGPFVSGGEAGTVTVTGASVGEAIRVVRGQSPGSTCPAAMGGECLDLDGAVIQLSGPADGLGGASFEMGIPAAVPVGAELCMQAMAGSAPPFALSDVVCVTIAGESELGDCYIDFAEAYAELGEGGDPTVVYGPFGVSFSVSSGFGVTGGDLHGDLTNWSKDGSVPDEAWGLWAFGPDLNVTEWEGGADTVSLDVLYTEGLDATVTFDAYFEGVVIDSQQAQLSDSVHSVTLSFPGPVDRLEHYIEAYAGFAYVIDNVYYNTDGFDCP